jgi:hypothetical protein
VRACDDVNNCSEASVEINLVLGEEVIQPEFSAAITWPMNGLAVSPLDFPLNVKLEVSNPKQTAKIEVYYKKDGQEKMLGKIDPAGNEDIVFLWRKPAEEGVYELYGKAYGWGGELKKTNSTTITFSKN